MSFVSKNLVPPPEYRLLRLVSREARWGLTLRGAVVGLVLLLCFFVGAGWGAHRFFAVTSPVASDLLVVEGWVPDYAIRAAAAEFTRGQYRLILSTGGPVQGMGGYVNDYSTAANIGAARLRATGLAPELVQSVPSRTFNRDRTYGSALALKTWLATHAPSTARITVMTTDVHARRTRLLFQMALGPGISVGIVAIHNPDYDANRWWQYSEGVRDVLGEIIAYTYAKLFFWP